MTGKARLALSLQCRTHSDSETFDSEYMRLNSCEKSEGRERMDYQRGQAPVERDRDIPALRELFREPGSGMGAKDCSVL